MWQASFAVRPDVLKELKRDLDLDENILRHIVVKRDMFGPLPTTHAIRKSAERELTRSVIIPIFPYSLMRAFFCFSEQAFLQLDLAFSCTHEFQ